VLAAGAVSPRPAVTPRSHRAPASKHTLFVVPVIGHGDPIWQRARMRSEPVLQPARTIVGTAEGRRREQESVLGDTPSQSACS
ncbi:MAG: hypothetical protein LC769_02175, partial [Chloroflexi bacterium]|nr:hypothetical protein [Chloroflexota bacterium]